MLRYLEKQGFSNKRDKCIFAFDIAKQMSYTKTAQYVEIFRETGFFE